jgi:hypothetical protein
MSDDKIVHIGKGLTEPPLKVVDTDYKSCQHRRYEVHRDLPQAFCRDCDALLEPFWLLRRIASDHQQRFFYVENIKRESAKMEKLVRRQQETRRSRDLAERDAREKDRLQKMRTTSPNDFKGDISIRETDA